jgi:hypothetical protein
MDVSGLLRHEIGTYECREDQNQGGQRRRHGTILANAVYITWGVPVCLVRADNICVSLKGPSALLMLHRSVAVYAPQAIGSSKTRLANRISSGGRRNRTQGVLKDGFAGCGRDAGGTPCQGVQYKLSLHGNECQDSDKPQYDRFHNVGGR